MTHLKPRSGRLIGALSGMILAGPAWLYGLCVGLLLGYMVDTVKAKAPGGSTADTTATEDETGQTQAPVIQEAAQPYHRLGLLPEASMAEIKKAWRIRSRQAHPDTPGGAAEDFMTLKTAYEQIMKQRKADTTKD